MSETITSAGQLLKEIRELSGTLKGASSASAVLTTHLSCKNRIPWQIGAMRFERLVDQATRELDILPEERRGRYRDTLQNHVRALVGPTAYAASAQALRQTHITELTIERLENFHDSLVLAGKSLSFEEARIKLVIDAIADLIAEMEAEPSDLDEAIMSRLTDLVVVLERYSLFGAEGVRDYVAALIGATLTRGMEVGGPLPEQVKSRINKVLGVSKAAMDGFVYLATGAQSVEWASTHFGLLAASS